ncbi:MAG TPA: CNNM domain-containing protein [Candidatus Nanoarchaeia archaeon]|nr:CNNM domain-containing protein [Candidatus Nanoarchaeia archaeon]
MTMVYQVIALIVLLALSAFFSASETALISISKLSVRHLVKLKKRGARELQLLKDEPNRIIITILIGNNIVNVTISALVTIITLEIFGNDAIGYAVGLTTFILLLFGEITPKSFASHYSRRLSLLFSKPVYYLSIAFYPIIKVLDIFTRLFIRIFGWKEKKQGITKEEIETMIEIGEASGALKRMEEMLVKNVFRFDDIEVEEIMTPKDKMFSLEAETTIKDAIPVLLQRPFTRVPIYMDDPENILGFISRDDILRAYANHKESIPLRLILKPIPCIFRDEKLDVLLNQFQRKHIHIAAVITRNHKLLGIVTLEDLLEELVGEIIDEKEIEALKLQESLK